MADMRTNYEVSQKQIEVDLPRKGLRNTAIENKKNKKNLFTQQQFHRFLFFCCPGIC